MASRYLVASSPSEVHRKVAEAIVSRLPVTLGVLGDNGAEEVSFRVLQTEHESMADDNIMSLIHGITTDNQLVTVFNPPNAQPTLRIDTQ